MIYANYEAKSMLACDLGDCRDNGVKIRGGVFYLVYINITGCMYFHRCPHINQYLIMWSGEKTNREKIWIRKTDAGTGV